MKCYFCLQILFRSGVLNELEAKRDVLLSDRIIQLQAFCRGYLSRKKMSQRRIQVSSDGFSLSYHIVHYLISLSGTCCALHTAECEGLFGRARLALVASSGSCDATVECTSHRGTVEDR